MSAVEANPAVTKKFGKGERSIPHSSQRARKFYPAYDDKQPKKARKSIRDSKLGKKLEAGQVLILLAGRFRGKRVILLKQLKEGVLLVTGPFKINGVPLRRVNHRYVIATSTKVDLSGIDSSCLERVSGAEYFSRENKSKAQKGEDAFMKQGDKPEAKKPTSERASDQKTIDKPILSAIKKEEYLASYLNSSFSLRHGQRPHEMSF